LTPILFEPLVLDSYQALLLNATVPNLFFADHIYCPSNATDGSPAYDRILCPLLFDSAWNWIPKVRTQLYNTAGFLTELGAVGDDNASNNFNLGHIGPIKVTTISLHRIM